MSYDPRLAGRPYGTSDEDDSDARRGGSVRAARERLQAAQRQREQPGRSRIVGLPQRPNQLVSQYSNPPPQRSQPQQRLSPPDSRNTGNAFTPSPQWPLPNNANDILDSSPAYSRSPNRGPPPQRPPRPVSDEFPIQPTSPGDYRQSYQSDDVFSPTSAAPSSRPLTTSSAASEASSLGSIPDFPVPQIPAPVVQSLPRRQPSLGPPPSSRRGPSSYYTQMSYVSPIAEESETRSQNLRSHHGSFASSNVIPSNEDDLYLEDESYVLSDDDETVTSDYGRESRGSDHDDRSGLVTPALVRQASLGRRTKPSLMTIKSVDSFGEKKSGPAKRKPVAEGVAMGAGAAGIGGAVLAARDGIAGRGAPAAGTSLGSGTALLDPSGSSAESLPSTRKANLRPEVSDFEMELEKDFEKEEPESPTHPLQQGTRQAALAGAGGKRRPPRLDIDAVRDAEARGSLTSLPELIRRATRLAANLDRGKTASRLGLDFWESGAPEKNTRRSRSLTDMLAAFPPPGEATPNGANTPNARNMSQWPSKEGAGYGTTSALDDRKSKRRRRCCGMPMWTFVTLLIVLLFLVAAAVIIPVVLIVIPKMKNTQTTAAQTTNGNTSSSSNSNSNPSTRPSAPAPTSSGPSGQCDGVISCQNGGVAILNSDRSCNCVCINGFTGKTCNSQGDAGCTTTSVAGTADNATLGSGIPRLFDSAMSNFSVPLDSTQLLSLFSNLGMSCNTENALVTFNGLASRSVPITAETTVEPSRSLPLLEMAQQDQGIRKLGQRQAIGAVGDSNQNTVATPTSAAQESASATPTQPISSNGTAIDFARVGVLLVLQETRKLDDAANAQVAVQNFLTSDRSGSNNDNRNGNGNTIDMGPFEMDLVLFSIEFKNGTKLQAQPS